MTQENAVATRARGIFKLLALFPARAAHGANGAGGRACMLRTHTGTEIAGRGAMRGGDVPNRLSADLRGARVLTLLADDGGNARNDGGAPAFIAPLASSSLGPNVDRSRIGKPNKRMSS